MRRRSDTREASLLGFGLRLAAGLAIACLTAGGVGLWFITRDLVSDQVRAESANHRADARTLPVPDTGKSPTSWLAEVQERLEFMQGRPGTLEAILIDDRYRIVAAGRKAQIGKLDRTPRVEDALERDRGWSGRESDAGPDTKHFEFIEPVDLPGGRYVFEITTDEVYLTKQLVDLRRTIVIASLIGWLLALMVFWATAGRGVVRLHRFALQRATLDGLTNLPNQRAFQEEMLRAAALADRSGDPLALILLDVDGFKFANDQHGHRHGDEQLRTLATILRDVGRLGDQAFRVGGDEFALLLPRSDNEGALHVAERIQSRVATSRLSVSIGSGELRAGQHASDLRQEVDAALYEAKRLGGARTVAFADIADRVSVTTAASSKALEALLADGDLDVAFQPIWDLASGSLLGIEALARPNARHGFLGPSEAFDVAQQVGRIHDLDHLCVTRILARAGELPPDALLFINVSPQTLDADADGNRWLSDEVAAAGVDPTRVVIEVTERVGSRTHLVVRSLLRLREEGFHIAIDDVGAGNSGLEMLRKVDASFIKIDRSVVVGGLADRGARSVLMAIAAFACESGAQVIAEGIEDEQILELILQVGTDSGPATITAGQGYGLGRPDARMPGALDSVPELLDAALRDPAHKEALAIA